MNISIPNPKDKIIETAKKIVDNFVFLDFYNNICKWLLDNKGFGLIIYREESKSPNNGLGKSLMVSKIIPSIIFEQHRYVHYYFNLRLFNLEHYKRFIETNKRCIIIIDELGREPIVKDFGSEIDIVGSLLEYAEINNCLVIIASNMSGSEIKSKYDNAILERIKSMCYKVKCSGVSYRKEAEL